MDFIKPWKFVDASGTFRLENPQNTSYLYFPLVNEAGMMSVVTPSLKGDAKTGQHEFLLTPVSVEDLHEYSSARNFWVYIDGVGAWSAAGNSAAQIAAPDQDKHVIEAGFLWHMTTCENVKMGLRADITNFVPHTEDRLELMKVTLTNITGHPIRYTPTAAIPIYGRSADNLRDHRHVTSLLHRTRCQEYGVEVCPVLSFDERGHHPNSIAYAVLGAGENGVAPVGFFPAIEDFIGEGGTLDWPAAVIYNLNNYVQAGSVLDGYETIGALRFKESVLAPGESYSYLLILAILPPFISKEELVAEENKLLGKYTSVPRFNQFLDQTKKFWQEKLATLAVKTGDSTFNLWIKWVALQPTLRRLLGNSFLPYHDYGRGGRGWRDLWQDILALLLMETGPVDGLLFSNYAGVRLDGSNATIIGSLPGEFKADRNNIPRVWMDHGLWPWATTRLYLDQTGDLDFLLREQVYFKDSHIYRCQKIDPGWKAEHETVQRASQGEFYQGTILEHLLVQHLTAFFHVGEHNNILLEGADWNDGMDMACQRGESVAFTAFFASNLQQLSQYLFKMKSHGVQEVDVLSELMLLLDSLNVPVNYASPGTKQARLVEYFAKVSNTISGSKTRLKIDDLAADLRLKAEWLFDHLRKNEWIQDHAGYGWFNGYYDNDGKRLEGDHPLGTRLTLTGQVFPLMGRIATDEQAQQIVKTVDHYLFDPKVGGYRLNTDFGEVLLNMGRCFGYAYGHKENGAMFSHMAVMYAYALYERGFVREGFKVLNSIYRQSVDFSASRMYPGIPEYFSQRGRGMYPYLTGSASWYLLTLVTKAFGVYGEGGNLVLSPKLVAEQFDAYGNASVTTLFAGRIIHVVYHNLEMMDFGGYQIRRILLDGQVIEGDWHEQIGIPRTMLTGLPDDQPHRIDVELGGADKN
jgi:cellobiose phosphorylase